MLFDWSVLLILLLKASFLVSLIYRLWLGKAYSRASAPDAIAVSGRSQDHLTLFERPPYVCVQLPIFNERDQIDELLASVCALDWPREQLVIQVLDDSDDPVCVQQTAAAIAHCCAKDPALDLRLIRRENRQGFKAGALNHGVSLCPDAEFFAIFDADFRPDTDFLRRMMPQFNSEPNVCAVQAAWSFVNARKSMLTRLQETSLGLHFHLEHYGRQQRGYVLNFNGTAGVWRRDSLLKLGGWSSSSVTEDLLLSYRAGLDGMKVRYVDTVSCSSELPETLGALLVQQRRWARGHGQVLRILRGRIWQQKGWSWGKRFDALFHLNSYFHSVLLSLGMIVIPLWIESRSSLMAAAATDTGTVATGSKPVLLADTIAWVLVFLAFGALYGWQRRVAAVPVAAANPLTSGATAAARASSGRLFGWFSWSGPSAFRWHRPLLVFAMAPYFSVLVLGSFLGGLGSQSPSGLIFNRTPKSGSKLKSMQIAHRDLVVICCVAGYLSLTAVFAGHSGLWLGAVLLGFQGLALPGWLVLAHLRTHEARQLDKSPVVFARKADLKS